MAEGNPKATLKKKKKKQSSSSLCDSSKILLCVKTILTNKDEGEQNDERFVMVIKVN